MNRITFFFLHFVIQGTHQIETLLENLVDKYFERFEIYTLHKILAIRENVTVVLKHNEVNFIIFFFSNLKIEHIYFTFLIVSGREF